MEMWCPGCDKMVNVASVELYFYKCTECGHRIKSRHGQQRDIARGTFGFNRR